MSISRLSICSVVLLSVTDLAVVAQTHAPRPAFDSFEVATIKPLQPGASQSRFIRMKTAHEFVAHNHTLKTLIAAAWNLNPKEISGGPSWIDSESFEILAKTPGDVRPTLEEQMTMLRQLLTERFALKFHREGKEMSIYALSVAKGGPKLKRSTESIDATPEGPPPLVFVVYPGLVRLPARKATITELTWVMQRAVLDRPVVDRTGLTGRFDFDLEFAPGENEFGGELPRPPDDSTKPGLFTAMREQLGLDLEATRGQVQAMVIDRAERPTDN